MVLGVLVVTVLGTIEAGGFEAVIKKASESNRIELFKSDYFPRSSNLCTEKVIFFFSMDPNPLVRHTFWTVTVGNFFLWLAHLAANQAILQRCLALPTIDKAKR
jgi:hypothetical protein